MFSEDVAGLFEVGLDEEGKEQFALDLADMGAKEASRYFHRAEGILEGFVVSAEALDECLYIVLCDARERARQARLRCGR